MCGSTFGRVRVPGLFLFLFDIFSILFFSVYVKFQVQSFLPSAVVSFDLSKYKTYQPSFIVTHRRCLFARSMKESNSIFLFVFHFYYFLIRFRMFFSLSFGYGLLFFYFFLCCLPSSSSACHLQTRLSYSYYLSSTYTYIHTYSFFIYISREVSNRHLLVVYWCSDITLSPFVFRCYSSHYISFFYIPRHIRIAIARSLTRSLWDLGSRIQNADLHSLN